ncbi:MAG: ferredoxin-thioredoxin reductase catalytic domain-containing protein [Candidatus Firestonebacteria bacterium]
MSEEQKILPEEIEKAYQKIKNDAENNGYSLNPDVQFAKDLVSGLLINEKRYGYWACPCRLSEGIKSKDVDIICPCDYRDEDLGEYGACYCGLYVSEKVLASKKGAEAIPERRPEPGDRFNSVSNVFKSGFAYPVWRCKVCGYLCAREEAPDICPICKVKKERFERFA